MLHPRILPDITSNDIASLPRTLKWVGMEEIAVSFFIAGKDGDKFAVSAKSSVYTSLDKADAKGIHMSRLHLILNNQLAGKTLSMELIEAILEQMLSSQEGISESARISLTFELTLSKPSLLSNLAGYQSYPVTLDVKKTINEPVVVSLELTIPYSSTCPCSASLSRQLMAEAIENQFQGQLIDKTSLLEWVQSKQGTVATPHSQRSYAYLNLSLSSDFGLDLQGLIFKFEEVIGTPVQTAVKREDEQAFAKLNAENLLFCEDAARRLKQSLEAMRYVTDYRFKVEHQESLHAHNAVVIDQKF